MDDRSAGILLPPTSDVSQEYLEGWCEGQSYLLANRRAEDAAANFIWRWIERAIFDDKLTHGDCLAVIAHHPSAPWKNGRWDVDHKPYAEAFYAQFPKARGEQP